MVIWSEFRVGRYRDNDQLRDAPLVKLSILARFGLDFGQFAELYSGHITIVQLSSFRRKDLSGSASYATGFALLDYFIFVPRRSRLDSKWQNQMAFS